MSTGVIDLTGMDDLPVVSSPWDAELLSEGECQLRIVNIFPDIDRVYVRNLVKPDPGSAPGRSAEWCERLIGTILDEGTYPKERQSARSLKRKRTEDDEDEDDLLIAEFEDESRENEDGTYFKQALKILQDEFRNIPVKYIERTLRRDNTLFKAFHTLQTQIDNYNSVRSLPFSKVQTRKPRAQGTQSAGTSELTTMPNQEDLDRELRAAKLSHRKKKSEKAMAEAKKQLEEANYRAAKMNNELHNCCCCFDEFPMNRMTYCNGETIHFFCLDCAKQYIDTQMELSKCRIVCFGSEDCGTPFARGQLKAILDRKTFERLERMQQLEDLREASLDALEECPFCDFKAEYPPVEHDKEFRCQNPGCRKTSCRLCRGESHTPKTCEEVKKDRKIDVRHAVEEAMTEAMVRNCNKCKKPFIKQDGCNKMTCPACYNLQCYVCSKNVIDYNHFKQERGLPGTKCPLYDDVNARHDEEVKNAEKKALERLRAENPDLSEEDLKIKVSNTVEKDEQRRKVRPQGVPPPPDYGLPRFAPAVHGIGHGLYVGEQPHLAHRPPPILHAFAHHIPGPAALLQFRGGPGPVHPPGIQPWPYANPRPGAPVENPYQQAAALAAAPGRPNVYMYPQPARPNGGAQDAERGYHPGGHVHRNQF